MKREKSKDGIREIILGNGKSSYEARVHRRGEKVISKRFPTKKAARVWKRGLDASIDKGQPVLDRKLVLISNIIDDYIKYRNRAKSPDPLSSNHITEYERVKLDFGKYGINKIGKRDIENWIALLLTESRGTYKNKKDKGPYQPASVRRFYYALKTAVDWHSNTYKYHVDEDLFNFPKKTIPAAWDGQRERRLDEGEEKCLYSNGLERKNTYTRQDWESIIGFALETALRLQELVWARWKDLRQKDYKLFIPGEHSKTGIDRVVLLSGKARAIVDDQRTKCPKDEPRIFYQVPSPPALSRAFAELTKRAAIKDLHFHDLRHEATSRLCEKGVLNQMQLMEMTGHSSMTTFKGYLHLLKHENSITLD